jgi:large subunit ribosomal protein LP0
LKAGDKVGNSEAVLLQKLHINPFDYGLVILDVYDNGSMFNVKVLDLTNEDMVLKFGKALQTLASICLEVGCPTTASTPHSVANAFKSLVAIAVESTNFSFARGNLFKAFLADPSAFTLAVASNNSTAAAQNEVKEEVQEEEIDLGGGMDMFGGEEGSGDY